MIHVVSELWLCDEASIKKCGHQDLGELPGWQYSMYITRHQCRESQAVLDLASKGQLEALSFMLSWTLTW